MRSRLYPPVKKIVSSDRGLILALFWGVAEALFWPILPDFYVFAATPAEPRRWWRLALFATVGSVIGGAIGYWLAYPRRSSFPLEYMPLITEGMIHQAGAWLAADGAIGVLKQPLSGIPYKVFVFLTGAGRLSFPVFLWASIAARSIRIFAITGIAAIIGRFGEKKWSRWYDLFIGAFLVVFAYALWRVVQMFPPPG